MLTIKIKKPNGQEEIFESSEVNKEQSGLLCVTEQGLVHLGKNGYHTSYEDITTKYMVENEETAAVYIMNRYGTTVATYHI